jgi:hypothetical protein
LKDEAFRGRVARVSPSHVLIGTERMLTSFPIQSLADAPSMVAFSRFPASLTTAAEVYANLEAAVRAAPEAELGAIFARYETQLARVDSAATRQLTALRTALRLDEPLTAPGALM